MLSAIEITYLTGAGAALLGLVLGLLLAALARRGRDRAQRERLAMLERQLEEQREQQHQLLRERDLAEQRLEQLPALERAAAERERELAAAREQESALRSEQAALKTELAQQRQAAEEKMQLLVEARQQLRQEFEVLANRIFDEKSERFSKHSKQALEGTLNPLREQLSDFRKKVEDVYDRESKERVSLRTELGHLKELNQRMSEEALNLTRALKGDNKAQGNWGEVVLERILEESGLHKGREYETQLSTGNTESRRRPDVVVRLPEQKDIVIDAKVSLVHYERYCRSADDTEKQQALKAHVASLRSHIESLSIKEYESLDGVHSLDFVLIFIPIEAAFLAAFEADQTLFRQAYDKNIIVVSPTTLLATLRTVQSIWRYERQNKNAEEIARQAGALHDKFAGFIADLDDVGVHLQRAQEAQHKARNKLAEGRGNLISRTVRLEKLGAKARKRLPADELAEDDESETGPLN